MKKLFIVRHAQADAYGSAASDFERPLSPFGVADAQRMAGLVARELAIEQAGSLEIFSCSPALRTRQTAALFLEVWGRSADELETFEHGYATTTAAWLDHIQGWDNAAEHGWIWGHNPELSMLASELSGTDGVGGSAVQLSPADIICLQFEIDDWGAVFSASGTPTLHLVASQQRTHLRP